MSAATSTESQARVHHRPLNLEKESSLISIKKRDGKLVTCKVRYSYEKDGIKATLESKDISPTHHLSGSDEINPNECLFCSDCSEGKALSMKKLLIVMDDPKLNSDSISNGDRYLLLAKIIVNIAFKTFPKIPLPETAELIVLGENYSFGKRAQLRQTNSSQSI